MDSNNSPAANKPPSRVKQYFRTVQNFSPNAKLLLARGLLGTFSWSIWGLIFNIYLLALGFDKSFVGLMLSYDWFAHGALGYVTAIVFVLILLAAAYLIFSAVRQRKREDRGDEEKRNAARAKG